MPLPPAYDPLQQAMSPRPATMGFGPLALLGGLSFLPALFSKLFGHDPRKQIEKLMSAQNIGKQTDQFYQQALGSPAYSQAQGTIAAGANQAGNQLAQSLGSRGIGTSGTASVLSSLLPSLIGGQQSQLRTGAYQSAQQQAMEQIQNQIRALMGQGPSQSAQMFAGGLNAFGPLLQSYLTGKYPGSFPRTQ